MTVELVSATSIERRQQASRVFKELIRGLELIGYRNAKGNGKWYGIVRMIPPKQQRETVPCFFVFPHGTLMRGWSGGPQKGSKWLIGSLQNPTPLFQGLLEMGRQCQ